MNRNILQISIIAQIIIIAFIIIGCDNNSGSEDDKWQLVWQDEFDGTAGQLPNATKWDYDIGTGWDNNQLEYDTDSSRNVSLDGLGHLAIVAREESYLGSNYTSARIHTLGLFEPTYGRFEARIKLPWGQGIWPAFWLLGTNKDTVIWPACGEIDIMEYRGQEPYAVQGSLHGPGYSGGNPITDSYELVNDRFDNDYHIFAVEWTAEYIKWYVDDILYQTVNPGDQSGTWVFDHSFYIILNLAVGGGYVGSPNEYTIFPQTMLVDYVRVYEEK